MAEYIERETAIRIAKNYGQASILAAAVAKELEDLPAADVVPVRRGRWEKTFEDYNFAHHCSLCKASALRNGNEDEVLSPYCPICGAKMDGEADGDD